MCQSAPRHPVYIYIYIYFFFRFNFPCNLTGCTLGDFDTIFITRFLKSTIHYISPRDQPLLHRKNSGCVMIPQLTNPLAKINSVSRIHALNSERRLWHMLPNDFHRKFVHNIEHKYSKSRSHFRLLSCRFRIIFIFVSLVSLSMTNMGSSLIVSLTISLTHDLYKLSLGDAQ